MTRVLKYLLNPEVEAEPSLKFLTFSLHDAQIGNMIVWLTGSLDSFDSIPYAASVVFELKYSETCLANKGHLSSGWDCFGVGIRINGVESSFEKEGFCTGDGFNS
jgi:hypothetical protein